MNMQAEDRKMAEEFHEWRERGSCAIAAVSLVASAHQIEGRDVAIALDLAPRFIETYFPAA